VPDAELAKFPHVPSVQALCGALFTELADGLLLFGVGGQSSLLVHCDGNVPDSVKDPLSALKQCEINVGEPIEHFVVETAPPDEDDEDRWSKQLLWQEDLKELRFEKGYGRTDCEVIELLRPGIFSSAGAEPDASEFHKTHALLRAFDSFQTRVHTLCHELTAYEQTTEVRALLRRNLTPLLIRPRSLPDVAHLLPLMGVMYETFETEVAAARAAGLFRPQRLPLFDRVCQQLFPLLCWLYCKKKRAGPDTVLVFVNLFFRPLTILYGQLL